MTQKRILLIDADGDIYAEACQAQFNVDGKPMQSKSEEDCMRSLTGLWEKYMDICDADGAILFLTDDGGRNWRKKILPTYKGNRSASDRPILLSRLRQLSQDQSVSGFVSRRVRNLEADDLCGIASTSMRREGRVTPIIVSQDKDMKTIPGLLWNPRPTALGQKREIECITDEDAFRNHQLQVLMGDSTDNYPGCPGIGPKRAITFINSCAGLEQRDVWEGVEGRFIEKGLTKEDALLQARVSYILQEKDWDKNTGKVRLWHPDTHLRRSEDE